MNNTIFYSKVLRFRKEGSYYYTLSPYAKLIRVNESGYQMLLLCENIHTFSELVEAMRKIYGLTEEKGITETQNFLEIMFKCGLLKKQKDFN